uniref:Uncharacterized protein n=1 Tax=Setaria italica TaxID=4555 RepID=K3Z1W9_SETIT
MSTGARELARTKMTLFTYLFKVSLGAHRTSLFSPATSLSDEPASHVKRD